MGDYNDSRAKDNPPNSRLFIVCNKQLTEDDFRKAFEKFGTIEEIWIVKDRNTGDPKGVVYIKYSKTSEAALALEEMNGQSIGETCRPLKVMIALNRDQGSKREDNESDRLLRLFIVVPKSMTESEIRNIFKKYGELDYVTIVKNRETKESKGLAYVKYHRMSHAAKAFEECDSSFKAVFARPKESKKEFSSSNGYYEHDRPTPFMDNFSSMGDSFYSESTRLIALVSPQLTQDQVGKLFDLVPGLEICRFVGESNFGRGGVGRKVLIKYDTPKAASYAMEKLNNFEYPLGKRIMLKPDFDHSDGFRHGHGDSSLKRDSTGFVSQTNRPPILGNKSEFSAEIMSLSKALAAATDIIKSAGLAVPSSGVSRADLDDYDPHYCSVKLPPQQPLAPPSTKPEERLFIVCQPGLPPISALWDVFGRFGNLIDVFILNGKNCGYVSYGQKSSADMAIEVLHGQEVCRMRLKVMQAEPPKSENRSKRFKTDHDEDSRN